MEQAGISRKQQPKRTKAERRRVVEETLKPGASVSQVARAHGVNANQVFAWRKLYREGRLSEGPGNTLLPVKLADTTLKVAVNVQQQRRRRVVGIIDIDLGHARVRIEGSADPECIRAAVEGLLR
jgi:transposase